MIWNLYLVIVNLASRTSNVQLVNQDVNLASPTSNFESVP